MLGMNQKPAASSTAVMPETGDLTLFEQSPSEPLRLVTKPAETSGACTSGQSSSNGQLATGSSSVSNTLSEQSEILASPPVKQQGIGSFGLISAEGYAAEIREEVDLYFQKIYAGQLTVEGAVAMLQRFNQSSIERENEILSCMTQSFFDRYRMFPEYPQKELNITAALLGLLIKHRLLSSNIAGGIALRCVLEALQKPPKSKMYTFGLIVLEQFLDLLAEWPQYCLHIVRIPYMRDMQCDLVDFIESTLAWVQSSTSEPAASLPYFVEKPQVAGRQVINYDV